VLFALLFGSRAGGQPRDLDQVEDHATALARFVGSGYAGP
jgi:hypothetical protein